MREQEKQHRLNTYLADIVRTSSLEQLVRIKAELNQSAASLSYKTGFFAWMLYSALVTQLVAAFLLELSGTRITLPMLLPIGINAVLCLAVFLTRRKRLDVSTVMNELNFKACCLKHGVQKLHDFQAVAGYLYRNFGEFNRGNYSREFSEIYTGLYRSEQGEEAPYYVYFFNWTDEVEYTVTKTDSDGQSYTETEVEYRTYYRNGILLPVHTPPIQVWRRGVLESSNGVSVASALFKSVFNARSGNDMEIARFLKPAVVELLLSFNSQLGDLGYESNGQGGLLITTTSNPLHRVIAAAQMDGFNEEMPLLSASLAHGRALGFQLESYVKPLDLS